MACRPTPGDQGSGAGPSSQTDTSSRSDSAPDHRTVRLRVSGDVGQGFGRHPVGGDLDRGGQHRHLGRHVQPHPDRGAVRPYAELLGPLPQGADQSELVQRGWPEVVDHPAHVGQGGSGVAPQGGQEFRGPIGVADQVGGRICGERDAGQGRPEAVMQVTAETPAFLLLGSDQSFTGGLQVLGDAVACTATASGAARSSSTRRSGSLSRRSPVAQSDGELTHDLPP